MELMRVAGATLNQTPLDSWNQQRMMAITDDARAKGVELLCLPEFSIVDMIARTRFIPDSATRSEKVLGDLLPATQIAVLGLPHFFHGAMSDYAMMSVRSGLRSGSTPSVCSPARASTMNNAGLSRGRRR